MAALLSIALFPIGLVALVQTQGVASQVRESAALAISALTEQAASRERMALRTARGAAEGLAAALDELIDDPVACSRAMGDFIANSDRFSFAGHIRPDATSTCSSAGRVLDLSQNEAVLARLDGQRAGVSVVPMGTVSRTSVVVIDTPVFDDRDRFNGYITISVPHTNLTTPTVADLRDSVVELITFNQAGEILTSVGPLAEADRHLPADMPVTELLKFDRNTMELSDRDGVPRLYTVAVIEPGQAYALGIWDRDAGLAQQTRGQIITSLFPALMWLAGLLVALTAVHRLVVRHLEVLGRQMALFTAARRMPEEPDTAPPTEIRRIQRAFYRMTERLLRDEASLEDAIREKSVLVKEIHHRVKNNLQLISSIINMQIRAATAPEAKRVLRQTQDRVLSMATIHRDLYQTDTTGLVNVGHLVREVVAKTIEMTPGLDDLEVATEVEEVWLYPDQAVPMSLLAAEAVMNALMHMPKQPGVARWLTISMARNSDRVCTFSTRNAAPPETDPVRMQRGIGRKLIEAFAVQLGGQVETGDEDGIYALTVTFTALEFAPLPGTF